MIRLFEQLNAGVALVPQNVGNAQVNGAAIVNPWSIGHSLLFIATAGAFATNDSITFKIELRRAGTSTWDRLKDPAGNDVVSTAQTPTGQLGTTGFWLGELDLNRIQTVKKPDGRADYDYDALRIVAINGVAQNVVIGIGYVIGHPYTRPVGTAAVEDLFNKQRYTLGNPDT